MSALVFSLSKAITRAWFVLVSLVLFGYPLSAILATVFGVTEGSLAGIGARAVTAALGIMVILLSVTRGKFVRTWVWFPLGTFWALYFLRLLIDTTGSQSALLSREPYEYWLFAVGIAALPMVALTTVPNGSVDLERMCRWLAGGAAILTAVVLYLSLSQQVIVSRLGLSKLNPISTGHLAATSAIVAAFQLMRVGNRGSRWGSGWSVLSLILSTVVLLMSGSRGPLVALTVALGVFLVTRKRRVIRSTLMAITLLSIGVYIFGVAPDSIRETASNRILLFVGQQFDDPSQAGVSGRVDLLREAGAAIVQSPLTGAGIETPSGSYPHNLVVEAFMATGVIGGTAFIASMLGGLFASVRIVRREMALSWLGLVHIQYLVGAMFSGALWGSGTYWGTLGAVFAVEGAWHLATRRKKVAVVRSAMRYPERKHKGVIV